MHEPTNFQQNLAMRGAELLMSQQIFRARFFRGRYSTVCFLLERRALNLRRTLVNHRRSQYECFRLSMCCFPLKPLRVEGDWGHSKTQATFRTFAPSVKSVGGMGDNVLSKFITYMIYLAGRVLF